MKWPYSPQEFAEWLVGGNGWLRLAWGGMRPRFWCSARADGVLRDGGPIADKVVYRYLAFGIWWRTN